MIIFLTFLFFVFLVPCFYNFKSKFQSGILYLIFSIILFIVCICRNEGFDRDYGSYVNAFFEDGEFLTISEPAFLVIKFVIKYLFNENFTILFVTYAIIGLLFKVLYLYFTSSKIPFFSFLLYYSYYFSLHEMTQIRIGAALTFFLIGLNYLFKRDFPKYIILILVATCFHFSAFIFLFLIFLNTSSFDRKIWILIPVCSIVFSLVLNKYLSGIFESINFGFFQYKVDAYSESFNSEFNVFNSWAILKIALCSLMIYKYKLLIRSNLFNVLLLKIYILSICVYFLFSFSPIFSNRLSDMLGLVEIILLPNLVLLFKPNTLGRVFIVLYAFSLFYLNIFYLKLFL